MHRRIALVAIARLGLASIATSADTTTRADPSRCVRPRGAGRGVPARRSWLGAAEGVQLRATATEGLATGQQFFDGYVFVPGDR
jgi:hypothetical protein